MSELNEKIKTMSVYDILKSNDIELIKQFKESLNNDAYPILKLKMILDGNYAIIQVLLTTKILMLEKELEK